MDSQQLIKSTNQLAPHEPFSGPL